MCIIFPAATLINDPHRDFLVPRHNALRVVNREGSLDEEMADQLVGRATAAENLVIRTPAATAEGAAIKMLVLLQMTAVGHEVSDEQAWPVVEEAARLLGVPMLADMGYLSPADQRAHEHAMSAAKPEAVA